MAGDERDLRHPRPRQLALMVSLLTLIAVSGPMHAAAATDGDPHVVADGLSNPRGVDVGPGGRLYVAEAGRGGDTRVDVTLGNGTNPVCVGATGAVSKIHRHRARTLTAASSLSATDEDGACPGDGGFATGPQGVAVSGWGKLSFTVGLGATEVTEVRADIVEAFSQASDLGTAQRLRAYGRTQLLGDLAQFETANPDGADVDSNPFGIAIDEDGSRLVADAGANTLVRLDRHDDPSLVAVFAPQCVTAPDPNPIPEDANPCGDQDEFPAQAVPTDIAIGPDGAYYVSELIGFPFTPGTSRVWRVEPGRTDPASCSSFEPVPNDGCEVYAEGLTSVVGIDFAHDGKLYAVQIADDGVLAVEQEGGDPSGSVQVIPAGGGVPTDSIGDLTAPGGIAVDGHHVYITNFSTSPDAGEVVRTSTR